MSNVSRMLCGLLALGMLNMAQTYQDQQQGQPGAPSTSSVAAPQAGGGPWTPPASATPGYEPPKGEPMVDLPIPQTPIFGMGYGPVLRKIEAEGEEGSRALVIQDQESGRELLLIVQGDKVAISENREERSWSDITPGTEVNVVYQMTSPEGTDVFGVPEEEIQYLAMFIGLGDNAPQGNE